MLMVSARIAVLNIYPTNPCNVGNRRILRSVMFISDTWKDMPRTNEKKRSQGSRWRPPKGQIIDASLIAAPRQRHTEAEKAAIRTGQSAAEIGPDEPAKAAQKDTDARWLER